MQHYHCGGQARQQVRPVVAARHVRQFVQQYVIQFRRRKLIQQRVGQDHRGSQKPDSHWRDDFV